MQNSTRLSFKKRDINLVYSKDLLNSKREVLGETTQREQKEGLEFSDKEYSKINNIVKIKN